MLHNMLQLAHHMASATQLAIRSRRSRRTAGLVAGVDGGAARRILKTYAAVTPDMQLDSCHRTCYSSYTTWLVQHR